MLGVPNEKKDVSPKSRFCRGIFDNGQMTSPSRGPMVHHFAYHNTNTTVFLFKKPSNTGMIPVNVPLCKGGGGTV